MTRARRWVIRVPVAVAALMAALSAGGCGSGGNGDATEHSATERSVAQVILLRGGKHAGRRLEVLLTRNGPKVFLAPDEWVFPSGGAESDNGGATAALAASIRTVAEQAGIEVAAGLVPYAQWIVPGFDTIFYLALAPSDATPRPDGAQTVDAGWFEPKRALDMHRAGKLPMGYPVIKQLESLVRFTNAADALEHARHLEVKPVELRVVGEGDNQRAVLPDEGPQGKSGSGRSRKTEPVLLMFRPGGFRLECDPDCLHDQEAIADGAGFDARQVHYPLGSVPDAMAAARAAVPSHRRTFAYGVSSGGLLGARLAQMGLVDAAALQSPVANLPKFVSPLPAAGASIGVPTLKDQRRFSPSTYRSRSPIFATVAADDENGKQLISPTLAWARKDKRVRASLVSGPHIDDPTRFLLLLNFLIRIRDMRE